MTPERVAVFGSSGFVGSAVMRALGEREVIAVGLPTIRVTASPRELEGLRETFQPEIKAMAAALNGFSSVINCAGVSDASAINQAALTGANSVVPGVIGAAAVEAGVQRFVHVSSAAVQGRVNILDDSEEVTPFSPYSRSKIDGELAARTWGPSCTVVYRPPGVHGACRKTTRSIARLARSPLSSVAAPGTANSPQALIENVADLISFLASTSEQPPAVVTHPSEGLSTRTLMLALGGKEPVIIPRLLATTLVALANRGGHSPRLAATARRLEVLWLGQDQSSSWAIESGWRPKADIDHWFRLGAELRERQ